MGRRARAFVESELSLESMQRAHEELYQRALGEHALAVSSAASL